MKTRGESSIGVAEKIISGNQETATCVRRRLRGAAEGKILRLKQQSFIVENRARPLVAITKHPRGAHSND